MKVDDFFAALGELGADFYTGVPDSLLSAFCNALYDRYKTSEKHIVAANEGAAVGLAAGHYLATKKPAVVYMQNSGIGNAVNPICSLIHPEVYGIPVIFVIGWRGEPGVHDEPQHVFQGQATLSLLDCLEIPYVVVDADTKPDEMGQAVEEFRRIMSGGRSVAFVVRKGALEKTPSSGKRYYNDCAMSRESAVSAILKASKDDDVFVSTTGKLSREVFEYRTGNGEPHYKDFLTVGSMGHSSMIALGVALGRRSGRVICLDGDGAMLMHMGSAVVVAKYAPAGFVHVVINNGAHESVGGMPVALGGLSLCRIAEACGYKRTYLARSEADIERIMSGLSGGEEGATFIEVMCNLDVRADLGRPDVPPQTNKNNFMQHLEETC